jgi:hypothetical protein
MPIHDGVFRDFDSSQEALTFENTLRAKYLPKVKELLIAHQQPFNKSDTIEF